MAEESSGQARKDEEMNEEEKTQRVRVVNMPIGIWTMGWLFTLGFGGEIDATTVVEFVVVLLATLAGWPYFLGVEIAKLL